MNGVGTIARITFLEAVREKVLYILVGFAVFLALASRVLSPLALGEGRRITIDLGLGACSVFGLLIVIFVGHSLVYREIERGTVAFLLSRPVSRGAFVAGKFLGLAQVLALAVVGMGLILGLTLAITHAGPTRILVDALLLQMLQLWILAAVAILISSMTSPVVAGLTVLGVWVIGNAAGSIADLALLLPEGPGRTATNALLWIVPRLHLYQGAREVVHGDPIGSARWGWSLAYAFSYIVACLFLARAAFARRPLVGV
jgi:ABC-type transport system involved in multi-copper enzyme maturation permease subunit